MELLCDRVSKEKTEKAGTTGQQKNASQASGEENELSQTGQSMKSDKNSVRENVRGFLEVPISETPELVNKVSMAVAKQNDVNEAAGQESEVNQAGQSTKSDKKSVGKTRHGFLGGLVKKLTG